MVLNMLSTGAMVRMGKIYGNLMVDLQATNFKLAERSKRIVCKITNVPPEEAVSLLQKCNGELKTAIVSHRLDLAPEQARLRLQETRGHLRKALENGHAQN
jgi:N-acetylmuramic acid 6-phosphate etherase